MSPAEGGEAAALVAVSAAEEPLVEAPAAVPQGGRRWALAAGLATLVGAVFLVASAVPRSAPAPRSATSGLDQKMKLYSDDACAELECDCGWAAQPGSCSNGALQDQRCFSCCCFHNRGGQAGLMLYHGSHAGAQVYQDPLPAYHGSAGDAYHGSVGDAYHGSVGDAYHGQVPSRTTYVVAGHNYRSGFHPFSARGMWWVLMATCAVLVVIGVVIFLRASTPKHYTSAAPPPPLPGSGIF